MLPFKAVLRCCVAGTATAGHERSSAMQTFARQVLLLNFSGINYCTPVVLQLSSCIPSIVLPFCYQQGQCSAIEVRLRCCCHSSTACREQYLLTPAGMALPFCHQRLIHTDHATSGKDSTPFRYARTDPAVSQVLIVPNCYSLQWTQ